MPEQHADILEVLIGQVGEDGKVNVVLGKALRVLGHAEFFEPVRNLLHCAAPSATVVRAFRAKISDERFDVNCRAWPLAVGSACKSHDLAARRREHCRPPWDGECP